MYLLISSPLMDMGTLLNKLLIYNFVHVHKCADWSCLLAFVHSDFKSAAARFQGSEDQQDTCLTTRSSFASSDFRFGCFNPRFKSPTRRSFAYLDYSCLMDAVPSGQPRTIHISTPLPQTKK